FFASQCVRSVAGPELHAGDGLDSPETRCVMEFHLTVEVFHIGQRQRRITVNGRAAHKLIHGCRSVTERMLALGVQRGEHANMDSYNSFMAKEGKSVATSAVQFLPVHLSLTSLREAAQG